jgi:hypothetical protein
MANRIITAMTVDGSLSSVASNTSSQRTSVGSFEFIPIKSLVAGV